jgi:hypothetical protein
LKILGGLTDCQYPPKLGVMSKTTARILPANIFIADSLEEAADRLPPSERAKADTLREAAKMYRALSTSKLVRIWEEKEDVNQAAARIVRETTGNL